MWVIWFCAAFFCGGMSGCTNAKNAAPPPKPLPRVMLVTEMGSEYEDSYIRSAFNGILRFYGETMENQKSRGRLYDVYVGREGRENMRVSLETVSEEGTWDIIAAVGDGFSFAIQQVAPRYPHQKYVITDEGSPQLDNVRQYVFVEQEGSYLVGAAAALKAVEDHVSHPSFGFIGGIPSSTITRFETGYIHGVHAVLPDAPVSIAYVNSWSDPEAARIVANNWYADGVFAVFSAAGGSGKGAIAAAREYRRNGRNVWVIGVDIDQYDEGLYLPNTSAVYTSMIKRVDVTIYDVLTAVYNGTFATHTSVMFDVASRGVGYTTTNPAMSASVIDELNKIEGRIIAGEIDIIAPD